MKQIHLESFHDPKPDQLNKVEGSSVKRRLGCRVRTTDHGGLTAEGLLSDAMDFDERCSCRGLSTELLGAEPDCIGDQRSLYRCCHLELERKNSTNRKEKQISLSKQKLLSSEFAQMQLN